MTTARFIASGFGTGRAPFAPGTVASFAALLSGAVLLWLSPLALAAAAALAIVAGYGAIRAVRIDGDPGWVTIDEFAGQWIAIIALPRPTGIGLALGFLLFRFFDITKLGPVGWADRRHGAFWIVADDVVAGLAAALVLAAANALFPRLFM